MCYGEKSLVFLLQQHVAEKAFTGRRSRCTAVAASAFVNMPAQAACLSTSPELPIPNNNCVTCDTTSSPVKAILYCQDLNLSNPYWQLTGATSAIGNFSN
jgi:hypothetical protein